MFEPNQLEMPFEPERQQPVSLPPAAQREARKRIAQLLLSLIERVHLEEKASDDED